MIKKIFLVSICCLFFLPNFVLGATDEFTVTTLVGGDVIPPTTPTMLSVDPIATDQIDVTWSTSTDNFLLSGYVLLRDGSPIATTTLTSFSDTGLTAETLYSYEVYAFDSSNNISTTSNALSTTTLAVVVPPVATTTDPAPSSGSQGTKVDSLNELTIITTTNKATIEWETNRPTKYTLRWGRSDLYEGGYIVSNTYEEEHLSTITDLEPGTVYLYEIRSITPSGSSRLLHVGEFRTKEIEVAVSPLNVERLVAVVEGNDVRLSWRLPSGLENVRVRVVRNYLGYPADPYNGAVVYEGVGTSVLDEEALSDHSPQYYTVFVVDKNGNTSSGAVVKVYRNDQEIFTDNNHPSIFDPDRTATSSDGFTTDDGYLEFEDGVIAEFGFDSSNINIEQGDRIFSFFDKDISLRENEAFIVSIPYGSLPKHLKSIVVTLLDPTDHKRSFSFLLRINKDRTAYEATIAPLNVAGISRLQVEIFDFESRVVGLYRKQIIFTPAVIDSKEVFFPDKLAGAAILIFQIFLFIFILMLLIFLWKRRKKETEDNR